MKKIKLLTPILSASALAGIVLPMTSCGCTNNDDSAIKESIYFKKNQTIDSYARYILTLDKDTYSNKDVTIKLSGQGSEKFIVSSFITNNMLIVDVKPIQFPEDEEESYTFNLNVKVGQNYKEFTNLVITLSPAPEEPTVNEHLKYVYDSDSDSYFAYCDLQTQEERVAWEVKKLYLPDTYDDGTNGLHPVGGISDYGFCYCTSIKKVTLPESVKKIGAYAFDCSLYNDDYTKCTCSGQIEKIVFLGTSQLEEMDSYAFAGQIKLTEITLPKTLKELTEGVFLCENTIYANDEETYICRGSLKKVLFEEGSTLKTIRSSAFEGQKELETFDLPNSVEEIYDNAFKCFDYSWTKSEEYYNSCGKLSEFNIDINNSKLTYIGNDALKGHNQLTSINIPKDCKYIGYYYDNDIHKYYASNPFVLCTNLKTFNVNSSNTYVKTNSDKSILFALDPEDGTHWTLASYPFAQGAIDLSGFDGLEIIAPYAFGYNDKITSVKITNESTSEIAKYAFYWCKNLNKIEFGKNIETVASYAFVYSTNLVDFIVDTNNNYFKSLEKDSHKPILIHYNSGHIELYLYPSANGEIDLSADTYDEIGSIAEDCFYYAPITSFKANPNTTVINPQAFIACQDLETIDLNMLVSLEINAFAGCYNIKKIKVNSYNRNFSVRNNENILVRNSDSDKELEMYLNNNGTDVDFSSDDLKDITIIKSTAFWNYYENPINLISLGNVVKISSYAFWYLNFTNSTLTIPATTTDIGWYAFAEQNGIKNISFTTTLGWRCQGTSIDVSNSSTNATNLTNVSSNWCGNGISRS